MRRDPGPWLAMGAAILAHATAFAGTFQFDDWKVVVDERRVSSLGAWWSSMPGIRPLLKLSFALNHASGWGLAGFHAVNVALHGLNALLVYRLLRRLRWRADGCEARPGEAWPAGGGGDLAPAGPDPAALLGALLFALHPVQTEAVVYVSGRSSSLAAALALASMLAWLAGRDRGQRWLTHAVSPLLMACSLGAKETAVVLPAALLLLEAADRRRPFSWRAALSATAVHWALLAAGLALFAAAPSYRHMAEHALTLRGPLENAAVQLSAVAWLAGQLLRPDALVADPVLAPPWPVAALAMATVVALGLAWSWRALRGSAGPPGREVAAALALPWFLLWLAPSGWWLPRPEPANDRQLYLALVGPAWWAASWLASAGPRRRWRLVLAALLLAGLGALTAGRNLVYRDEVTFWVNVARRAPGNPRAYGNLGFALARCGRGAEAEAALSEAIALDPGYLRAGVNLRLLREGLLVSPGEPAERRCPAR